eukprot:COSAG05_NODE_8548_length_694_cov_0.852101_1_plen_27_part_10
MAYPDRILDLETNIYFGVEAHMRVAHC